MHAVKKWFADIFCSGQNASFEIFSPSHKIIDFHILTYRGVSPGNPQKEPRSLGTHGFLIEKLALSTFERSFLYKSER
jgi:hypothetical protein